MEYISIPKYIVEEARNSIRMAANALDSRERLTAMDRQIEHSGRLLDWVLNGQVGNIPKFIPEKDKSM